MELRHITHFVAVAEERHFGRAAQRVGLAQPALSQSVRQLETELGVQLLERTTRHVSTTPAGDFFYRECIRNVAALDRSARGVRRIQQGDSGLVRIGFTGTASFDRLPSMARIIKQRLPDVALEIHGDLLTPSLVHGLRSEELDIAVLRPPVSGDDLAMRTIAVEPLVVALPIDHRLSAEPALDVAEFAGEQFVMYSDAGSAVNEAATRACRAAGFTPHREHEASSTSVLLALVAAGLGVAFVPDSARRLPLLGINFRDVGRTGTVELALAWRKLAVSALVENVVRVLGDGGLFSGDRPVAGLAGGTR